MIGDGTQVVDETGRRHGWRRPVALPDDVESAAKATGIVELPVHVYWSGEARRWDLGDRRQRARVYEIVLSEGTDDDVRRFIDVDEVIRMWSELYLPKHVRDVWRSFVERARNIDLVC